jgi:hypothetical protein
MNVSSGPIPHKFRLLSLVALLSLALCTLAVSTVTPAHATTSDPPGGPPNRHWGTVQLDGQRAPAGTEVMALIDDQICGTTVVRQYEGGLYYVLDVASASFQAGCGTDGATVAFKVGSARAAQTATWQEGRFTHLNLTASGLDQPAQDWPAPAPSRS